jgi:hypothetical protein
MYSREAKVYSRIPELLKNDFFKQVNIPRNLYEEVADTEQDLIAKLEDKVDFITLRQGE